MLTVTAICNQYAWLYTSLTSVGDVWDHLIEQDGCFTGIKRVDGIDYVMFRGSVTFADWWQDFDDLALPYNDPQLGPIHPGAHLGIISAKDLIDARVGDKVVVVGHSLGAMHAALYTGYRVAAKKPVSDLVMFGEPRTGGSVLSNIIAQAKVNVQSFRNANDGGHDLVTDVARALPPLLPYQHVKDPLTDCRHDPRLDDPWVLFRYHHFGHYCRAFGCGSPQALSLSI